MKTTKKTRTHWARLSVDYYRDPAILAVGPVGEVAFVRLLALARERVEVSAVDGAVDRRLAVRELREVVDLWDQVHGGGMESLLTVLAEHGLITYDATTIVLVGYTDWQTTRAEIERTREDARARQQASRDRRRASDGEEDNEEGSADPGRSPGGRTPGGTSDGRGGRTNGRTSTASAAGTDETAPGGEDEDMGVYDEKVEAFADLRDAGEVKKGRRKVGKHGLDPKQVADAERVVAHLAQTRRDLLGGNFRITDAWWADVRKLLNGTADTPGLTADQICDLIDFALSDKFWHAHCQTPAGLVKHGGKLFSSDEYVRWSKSQGRPKANRPRDTLVGDKGKPVFRGELVADKKTDWSQVSENF